MARIRSLKQDKNDDTQFRHGRIKHVGTMFTEFHQPVPFFFTRDRMPLHLIGQFRGRSCFFLCNGPSMVNGYYDLSLLKKPGIMTYGINNGPRTVRPNFWSCVDDPKRFLRSIWMDSNIQKFVPAAHANKQIFDNEKWCDMVDEEGKPVIVGDCPNVVYFHRNEKLVAERFLYEDTICWGNTGTEGGGRSVMLPVFRIIYLLGFRKIYLLGADFKMTENQTYHFDEQRNKGAVNCNMSTYARMKDEYFPALKPYFDAEGLEVYNLNPDSELKVFPFKDYYEAIKESNESLGDVENERTWGMYSKPEEREKWKEEPDDSKKAHLKTIVNRPTTPINDVVNLNKDSIKNSVTKQVQQVSQEPKISQVSKTVVRDDEVRQINREVKPIKQETKQEVRSDRNEVRKITPEEFQTMSRSAGREFVGRVEVDEHVDNDDRVELEDNVENNEIEGYIRENDDGDIDGIAINQTSTPIQVRVLKHTDNDEFIDDNKENNRENRQVELKQEKEYRHISPAIPDRHVQPAKSVCNYIKSMPCGNVSSQANPKANPRAEHINQQKIVKPQNSQNKQVQENITIEDNGM